jgi:hypothetical protein
MAAVLFPGTGLNIGKSAVSERRQKLSIRREKDVGGNDGAARAA